MTDPTRYDVIVLGLGATGAATTYQLARRGARVLGVDRFSPPHDRGSSHGDTRLTREAIGEGDAYVPLVLRSHEIWRALEVETGTDLFTVTGGLMLSSGARDDGQHGVTGPFAAATAAAAGRFGIPHEVLDARSVTVRTDRGCCSADQLVIAAGPWAGRLLGPGLAPRFAVYRQVLHWFEITGSHERLTIPTFPVFIWEFGAGADDMCYGFPAVDGPAGGLKIAGEQYGTTVDPDRRRADDVTPAEAGWAYRRYVRGRLPDLGPRCLRAASCLYTVTPGYRFVLARHPDTHRVIVASPCSGHGFKHSAAIGEALAELALEGRSRLDLTAFGWDPA